MMTVPYPLTEYDSVDIAENTQRFTLVFETKNNGKTHVMLSSDNDRLVEGHYYWNTWDGELVRVNKIDGENVHVGVCFGVGQGHHEIMNRNAIEPDGERVIHLEKP